MQIPTTQIGIIGLAVMGRSLALNMADHGFKVGGTIEASGGDRNSLMRDIP